VTNFSPFCTIGISMYQKRILPYFIIPSTFSPQASSPLSHHRRTDRFQHPFHPYFFFFPLSARGPTRRRNSTGLAELWGGWPTEQVSDTSALKRKSALSIGKVSGKVSCAMTQELIIQARSDRRQIRCDLCPHIIQAKRALVSMLYS
jgi:hypothetical protein